jgi:Bacterial PH domain
MCADPRRRSLRYSEEPDFPATDPALRSTSETGVGANEFDEQIVAHNSEGAATAGSPALTTSLATLLASHILRDGELVLLILKPSLWFILLSSLRYIAIALILMIAVKVFDPQLQGPHRGYIELGTSVIVGRLVWASFQWMGRLYILTDMRILSLWGVVNIDIFDCPLRKVARTRLIRGVLDRLVGVGSIEIIPQDESYPFGLWLNVAHPVQVHQKITATINRARQGGMGCD